MHTQTGNFYPTLTPEQTAGTQQFTPSEHEVGEPRRATGQGATGCKRLSLGAQTDQDSRTAWTSRDSSSEAVADTGTSKDCGWVCVGGCGAKRC